MSSGQLAWLVAAISMPSAGLSPLVGALNDRIGRKAVIVPSLALYGAGGLLAALAGWWAEAPYPWLVAGRLLQGVGSSAPMQLTMAVAGDMFQSAERAKAVGILETANGVGKVVSPLLGGVVGTLGWQAVFLVYPAAAAAVAVAVALVIDEPPARRTAAVSYVGAVWQAAERPAVWLTFAAGFTFIFALLGTSFWLTETAASRMGWSRLMLSLAVALPMAGLAVTSLTAQFVQTRAGVGAAVAVGGISGHGRSGRRAFVARSALALAGRGGGRGRRRPAGAEFHRRGGRGRRARGRADRGVRGLAVAGRGGGAGRVLRCCASTGMRRFF